MRAGHLIALLVVACLMITFVKVEAVIKVKSKFRIELSLNQEEYKLKDKIRGEIKITNESRMVVPAKFWIRLYHKDELKFEKYEEFKELPIGISKYDLNYFDFPNVTSSMIYLGTWHLEVYPEDDPDLGDEIEFEVIQR